MKAFFYFLPRILSVAIVAFFLLMSFDEPILSVGFLMHNIPTLIMTIPLVLFWRNNLWSGIIYLVLAIATAIFFHTYTEFISFLIVTMPFLLVSILHFVNHLTKNES